MAIYKALEGLCIGILFKVVSTWPVEHLSVIAAGYRFIPDISPPEQRKLSSNFKLKRYLQLYIDPPKKCNTDALLLKT